MKLGVAVPISGSWATAPTSPRSPSWPSWPRITGTTRCGRSNDCSPPSRRTGRPNCCPSAALRRAGRFADGWISSSQADLTRADLDVLAADGVTKVFLDVNFDPTIGSPDADPNASMRRARVALIRCHEVTDAVSS